MRKSNILNAFSTKTCTPEVLEHWERSPLRYLTLVHPHCQYQFTHPKTMDMLDLHDHWLPFWSLSEFMEIPYEHDWDNKQIAFEIFKDFIHHQQLRSKEVQNNEDNQS